MSDVSSASCGIAVMAKASLPGRTKTRLVPPLTFEEAAALNTVFLKDVFANIAEASRAVADPRLCCLWPCRRGKVFRGSHGAKPRPHPGGVFELRRMLVRRRRRHAGRRLLLAPACSMPIRRTCRPRISCGSRASLPAGETGSSSGLPMTAAITYWASRGRISASSPKSTGARSACSPRRSTARRNSASRSITLPRWNDIDDAQSLRYFASARRRGEDLWRRAAVRGPA